MSITAPTRIAQTSVPILGVLAERWSPRSFDNTADVTELQLTAALEAAEYDLGQSVAHLSVQAHHDGLHVHQMGGIVADGLKAAFGLSDTMRPMSVVAVGVLGQPGGVGHRSAAQTRGAATASSAAVRIADQRT